MSSQLPALEGEELGSLGETPAVVTEEWWRGPWPIKKTCLLLRESHQDVNRYVERQRAVKSSRELSLTEEEGPEPAMSLGTDTSRLPRRRLVRRHATKVHHASQSLCAPTPCRSSVGEPVDSAPRAQPEDSEGEGPAQARPSGEKTTPLRWSTRKRRTPYGVPRLHM